jgi:hypothetical protein
MISSGKCSESARHSGKACLTPGDALEPGRGDSSPRKTPRVRRQGGDELLSSLVSPGGTGAVPSESPPRPALGAGRRHGSLRRILEQRLIEKLRRLRRDAFEELGQREKVVQDLQFQRPARRLHRMPMRKVALPRAALRMPVQKISAKGASLRVAVRKIARCTSACRRWFKKLESIRHRSQPGPRN